MRLAPSDRALSKRIKGAAVTCSRIGEGYYLVGFDWQPHPARSSVYDDTKALLTRHSDRCYRAIVKVERHGSTYKTIVMQIGGDQKPFSLAVRHLDDAHSSTSWRLPDSLGVLEIQNLLHEDK